MIYLDYSATTPVNEEVIDTYSRVCKEFIGNPNSIHKLGVKSKELIDASTKQIADILGVKESEIIYTSGASESNNTAVKGVCLKYENRGRHIISTELEHSSIIAPLNYLASKGWEVDFVKLDKDGLVDLDDLEKLIRDDTVLVTIGAVNSEVGVLQDIKAISEVIHKKNSRTIFHSDVTQCIGKVKFDFSDVDLASISAQKFYGMKGVGALIKREKLIIEPLIHGGKSTTVFRSGTPATPLVASFAKALRLAYEDFDKKTEKVISLRKKLISGLEKLDVIINSNDHCLPYMVNVSLKNIKSEVMLHALEEEDIYISTQTACSTGNYSKAVYAITHDKDLASSSIRVSLSHLTTEEEIDTFLKVFEEKLESLSFRR